MRLLYLLLALALPASSSVDIDGGNGEARVSGPKGEEGVGIGDRTPRADTVLVDLGRRRLFEPPPVRDGRPPRGELRLGLARISTVVSGFEVAPLPNLDTRLLRTATPVIRHPDDPPETFLRLANRDLIRSSVASIGENPDRMAFLPPADLPTVRRSESGDLIAQYTDLGMRVRGRAELDGDWTRFRPCTNQFQESCQPSLFPQLQPDVSLAVQVQGTILDRVRVDVDYDQLREFGSTNTISVVYDGRDDEIVQHLEIGDVTFDLPRSRFLTRGIPAGNFGFQLDGQLGPVDFNTVWAEQRGDLTSREFRLSGVGNQRRFVQQDTVTLDDSDFARGQFFFLTDPSGIQDYPHIDVLSLDAGAASSLVVPGAEPVQVYRFDASPSARQQVEGYIQADAVSGQGADQVSESGWFRPLIPGQEYFVHPSGLWIALRNPLARDEMLAVTFITAAGDTIGDYNPEEVYNRGQRPQLRLLKASDANHQPGRSTWELEMHQIYRVSASSDVDPNSLDVTISLGEPSAGRTFKRAANGNDVTFLQLMGLDTESPLDRIDQSHVYRPGDELFQDTPVVSGTFIVFPTLRPFLEPPATPSLGLTEADAKALLGNDANDRIYESEDPFERLNGGLFRITVPYEVRSEGVISSFSLGAIGIRPGSERILLGQRPLVRGLDYQIAYEVGQVTLLNAEALFSADPDAPVRATWEQQQFFRSAPTSVLGLNATIGALDRGQLDFVALYQAEKTLVRRPTLGLEPSAITLGGLSGRVERPVHWLDGLLSRIPGLRTGSESAFRLEGELAVSLPNPNQRDAVFLDDFDASDARPLSLLAWDWTRGSAPTDRVGADDVLPMSLDETDLATMAWQHTWIVSSPEGDSIGIQEGFLPREEIDQQIRVAGTRAREPGLRLTYRQPGLSGRTWSSITTTLSPSGTDLTKSDFIEFYVSGGTGGAVVVDLGVVSEDAMFRAPGGNTSGLKDTGTPWGLGILDQEADPARGQVWGNVLDRQGVWGENCESAPGSVYRLGDPRANCTRNNGRNDSEDLDGDGNLDTTERSLRYVVRLDGRSPFLVRHSDETGTPFQLYRIPIRGAGTQVNGPVTEADLRSVKQIRLTVTGDRSADLTFARMRIVGSRWIRRGQEGVLTGVVGDTTSFAGRLEVGPVSQLTTDGYASPPGVLEELADPTSALGSQGVEFNERSLSIAVEALQPGDRGEVYSRFPQRPRNFLAYREARLWVVPREGDWGLEEDVTFFLKIGTDPENFYLYRTNLRSASGSGAINAADWLPEVVIDFDQFLELRRRAEESLVLRPPGPGEGPVTIWAGDSTYAVVLSDRGRAPDLANVRELSMGIWNQSDRSFDGEVWVDELRLGRGVGDMGVAGMMEASLLAGDVIETRVSLTSRGADFQQLDERPTYQTDRVLSISTLARLDRLTPAEWGIEMPLSVVHDRSDQDPAFLNNSDVLPVNNLRETGDRQTRISLGFRKATPTANPIIGAFLDGLDANLSSYQTRSSSVSARLESEGFDARLGYSRRLEPREVDLIPDFLEDVLRVLLPGGLEEAVTGARLRWSPESFSLGASYLNQDNQIFRFERIIEGPVDSLVAPLSAPREGIETVAEVTLRPLESLTADLTFLSSRDLLRPQDAVADPQVQGLLREERSRLAGLDVGWETDRVVRTRITYRPQIWTWLEHGVTWTTRYDGERNPAFVGRTVDSAGDSVLALQRSLRGERNIQGRVSLDLADLTDAPQGGAGPFSGLVGVLRPVSLDFQKGVFSRFNRDLVDPDASFQFGLLGREGFRVIDGDTAATLTDRDSRRWSVAMEASGLGLDLGYGESRVSTLDTRADRTVQTRSWPDIRARASGLNLPDSWSTLVTRLSLSSGITRSTRETRYGQVQQTRRQTDLTVPWDVTIGWAGSLVTRYRGTVQRGDGSDPTGDTERDRTNHAIQIQSAFLPPLGMADRFDRPVQMTVGMSYTSERECRASRARQECVAFVDQLSRVVSITLDTEINDFEIGLQGSWTDRQSFVGQRTGSTQFQLGIFGQFLLEAGRFGPNGF